MIHERASGIVSHSITSGKESLGKPLEQEYLARVCIIPVRGVTAAGSREAGRGEGGGGERAAIVPAFEQGGNFVGTCTLTNERETRERAAIEAALKDVVKDDRKDALPINSFRLCALCGKSCADTGRIKSESGPLLISSHFFSLFIKIRVNSAHYVTARDLPREFYRRSEDRMRKEGRGAGHFNWYVNRVTHRARPAHTLAHAQTEMTRVHPMQTVR